jgi:hypothetical protein
MGGAIQLALRMVPRSAQLLHARLLETVMKAPLAFFTITDTGTITNRQVETHVVFVALILTLRQIQPRHDNYRCVRRLLILNLIRGVQKLTLALCSDTELPYSLIDFIFATFAAIMAGALMCVSASYFAATLPPVGLAVWSMRGFFSSLPSYTLLTWS